MPSTEILEQRKALALQQALADVHEDLTDRGIRSERITEAMQDPILQPEYALPLVVAELARALADEREARKALGRALGELHERVEALEGTV
jgi:hypothetical protein